MAADYAGRTPIHIEAPAGIVAPQGTHVIESGNDRSGRTENVHIIKFDGGAEIKVDKAANKEQILNVMLENMKGILIDFIKEDIFEEGDLAYDF
jgi:hypothetical protein